MSWSTIRTYWEGLRRVQEDYATAYETEDGIHVWCEVKDQEWLELVFEPGTIPVVIPEGHDVMLALLVVKRFLGIGVPSFSVKPRESG